MNMNKVEFTVPLCGSELFDMHSRVTAQRLCAKFIGLNYEVNDKTIRIYGELSDYWYDQFHQAVFKLGDIEV